MCVNITKAATDSRDYFAFLTPAVSFVLGFVIAVEALGQALHVVMCGGIREASCYIQMNTVIILDCTCRQN
jgi:hypothetical protein